MEMQTNAINWFEIPVVDFERARKFYSTIYDYQMPELPMGPTRMGFFLCDPEKGVGGAICQGEGMTPSKLGTKVYLGAGNDLNTVLSRVEGAGGKVVMEKTEITPEYGYYAVFEDTEGNEVCLHSMQ